jgi:hypothetical protein
MRYLVQYMVGQERKTAEVQASSPQEAVVKLQHTRSGRDDYHGHCHILSVVPESTEDEWLDWPVAPVSGA